MVTLATVWTPSELQILITLLRTHGIWTNAVGERHAAAEPGLAVALGGMHVRIRVEDLPLAVELIDEVDREPYRGPIFSRKRFANAVAAALMIVAMCPAPARIPVYFHYVVRKSSDTA